MYRVLGFERVDYVSKKGNHVKGHKLYLCFESDKIEGFGALECYISHSIDYIPVLDQLIDIYYNRFGQVSKISIIA